MAMIAFMLPDATASKMAIEGGEPASELHITLAYLGGDNEASVMSMTESIRDALMTVARYFKPLTGQTGGGLTFDPEDGRRPVAATVDVPGLDTLRVALVDELKRNGVPVVENHGFTPHITLAYVPAGGALPVMADLGSVPLVVNQLSLVAGDGRFDVDLTGDMIEEKQAGKAAQVEAFDIEFHLTLAKALPEGDDLIIEGYASTAVPDRVGDMIEPDAFQAGLDAYMANPIVLYNHNIDRPVGKVLSAKVDQVGLKVRVAIDKSLEWGRTVADMIGKRILNAFSVRAVGDRAVGYLQPDGTRRIVRWDLQEISVVTVPAHQQALFSVAKAFSQGSDVISVAGGEPAQTQEVDMPGDNDALVQQVSAAVKAEILSEIPNAEAVADKVLAALDAQAKAKADQEQRDREARKAMRAEIVAELQAEAGDAPPKTTPFPMADLGKGPNADAMANFGRLVVGSKFDRVEDLELVKSYYLASRMARAGQGPAPSERFRRAAMVRAAKFMRATDDVAVWDTFPGARPRTEKVPAFDPTIAQPYVAGDEDVQDVIGADGKVLARQVQFSDNVSAKGLTQLMEIGAKDNEVIYSTQSGYGDEWVPTLMSAMLWRTVRLNAAVLGLFENFDMPSQPYDWPKEGADPTYYKVPETTNEAQLILTGQPTPDSKIGTGKVTFSAGKIGGMSFWSEEQVEDSLIGAQAAFREQYGVSFAHAIDELLISGDETATTSCISDYGNGSIATTFRLLTLDGLRHQPLAVTTTDKRDGGTLTADDINATRALMGTNGVFGADPSQLVLLTDVPTAYKFEDLSEVLTVDKYGPLATILLGELARIKGIPLIKSQDYGLTDTSGYIHNTSGNNTKGSFMLVNRAGVKVGWRRRPRIFVGQVPFSDAWYIIASARLDIQFREAGMVAMSYNLTV